MLQKQGLLKEGIPQLTPPVTPKKLGTRADFLQMAKKVSIKMEQF